MPSPNQKLAASLEVLQNLQKEGRRIFKSTDLTRTHRERLMKHGFLKEIMKGWLLSSSPQERDGESTSWYASFWEFLALYCHERFGEDWHLSPEQSMLIHAESTIIPKQVIIYSSKGSNNNTDLLYETSLYDLKHAQAIPENSLIVFRSLRIYTLESSLVKTSPQFYRIHPLEAQVALSQIKDPTQLLRQLLEEGHSTVAGRLAGGFRRIGQSQIADTILSTMKQADYDVREKDPFEKEETIFRVSKNNSALSKRICALWDMHRQDVEGAIPAPSSHPVKPEQYIKQVEEIYVNDAYNSLSIEGYQVTPELIQKISRGHWHPDKGGADQQDRDALAARGYWQAFNRVKESLSRVLAGESAGKVVREDHSKWYQELFQPSVAVGLLQPSSLAGYRNDPVYLRNSRYIPPRWEAVFDGMQALFDKIEEEENPGVSAILGHWLFGYIHPYPDGNGRVARFLMNVLLASGRYPWTIIKLEDRRAYLSALDQASVDGNIKPFAGFIGHNICMKN